MGNEVSQPSAIPQAPIATKVSRKDLSSRRLSLIDDKRRALAFRRSLTREFSSDSASNPAEAPSHPKTPSEKLFITNALSESIIYNTLRPPERESFLNAMELQKLPPNITLMRQNEPGDCFYVLSEGTVVFSVDGKPTRSLSPGSFFGEMSFLCHDRARSATCVTETTAVLWRIHRDIFRDIVCYHAQKERQDVVAFCKKVDFLKSLDEDRILEIAEATVEMDCDPGRVILKKGDPGRVLYFIREGTVKIDFHNDQNAPSCPDLTAGDYFGERSLITGEARSASAVAITSCRLLCLTADAFHKTVGGYEHVCKAATRKRLLASAHIFRYTEDLEPKELDQMVDLFSERSFEKDEIIVEEGQPLGVIGNSFFLIERGGVRIINESGKIVELGEGGHFVGGQNLDSSDETISSRTILALQPTVCALLTKSNIESVIVSVSRLGAPQSFRNVLPQAKMIRSLNDLNVYRIIGHGYFGVVRLVATIYKGNENKDGQIETNPTFKSPIRPYALKTIPKTKIIKSKMHGNFIREKNILSSLDYPLVIKMVSTFQDSRNIYELFEFIQGGELVALIRNKSSNSKKPVGISAELTRFYTSCILLAFNHIHNRFVCHRNISCFNVLIDSDGYAVLINFREAKVIGDKSYTFCGTPEYVAPEVILYRGHDHRADYWSLGVLVYEMLAGVTPFETKKTKENDNNVAMFKRIVKAKYTFPANGKFCLDSIDLIKNCLLVKNPMKRINSTDVVDTKQKRRGSAGTTSALKKNEVRHLRRHDYFLGVNWKGIHHKQVTPQYVPKIKGDLDPSNFCEYKEPLKDFWNGDNNDEEKGLTEEDQELFMNF